MAGIFKKKGLNLEILFTAGSGETLQAVISGAVDIGVAVATSSAMGAIVAGPGIPAALAAEPGCSEPDDRAALANYPGLDKARFWLDPDSTVRHTLECPGRRRSPLEAFRKSGAKAAAGSTGGSALQQQAIATIGIHPPMTLCRECELPHVQFPRKPVQGGSQSTFLLG
jgi:hypothetical protein